MPAGSALHFTDLGSALEARNRTQRSKCAVGRFGSDEGDERSLVGDVHGIDAEDLACAGDRRLNRDVRLADDGRQARRASQAR